MHSVCLYLFRLVIIDTYRISLYIGLMLSFGGGFASIAAVPGVQIALDLINNDPDILPGYKLHYSLSDSQVYIAAVFLLIILCLL